MSFCFKLLIMMHNPTPKPLHSVCHALTLRSMAVTSPPNLKPKSMIFRWFAPTPREASIASLYGAIVAQARSPAFYQTYRVPDTRDWPARNDHPACCPGVAPSGTRERQLARTRPGAVRPFRSRYGRQHARNGCRRSRRAPENAADRGGILWPASSSTGAALAAADEATWPRHLPATYLPASREDARGCTACGL